MLLCVFSVQKPFFVWRTGLAGLQVKDIALDLGCFYSLVDGFMLKKSMSNSVTEKRAVTMVRGEEIIYSYRFVWIRDGV